MKEAAHIVGTRSTIKKLTSSFMDTQIGDMNSRKRKSVMMDTLLLLTLKIVPPLNLTSLLYLKMNLHQLQQIVLLPEINQDILTKEIIGRGTKRGGLYYMDDFSIGRTNNVGRNSDKEREVWHNRGKPPNRYSPELKEGRNKYPIANHVSTKKLSHSVKTFVHKLFSEHIPNTVQEALHNLKWTQAINEEMAALEKNNTWKLVPLPKERRTIGCK
ncbi:uncharacterized protein LOC125370899 [Ricinus communis]|uniref:uncharacterized protein LOC125370899 n=1 Tax=Ricinus communis TaxID=3988 RepID=UPI00201A42DD|nr:uncharacterized protein LOC125370899 [Ricinus communis]